MSEHQPGPRAEGQRSPKKKVTTASLRRMKQRGERISALTAYDHLMAGLLDEAGVDVILVGDSVAMVVQGFETTVGVTMAHMLYHAGNVSRSVQRALVVGDLPFMSYQVNSDEALRNAGRMVQEAGVEAVKVEGGRSVAGTVRRIVEAGIPVMGHVGLTPQSIHKFGTYQVRATGPAEAEEVFEGARALEDAGAFAIVVEKVPAELGQRLSQSLSIPVIGIGAGPDCDGQILVSHDMLGLYTKFHPRFVRRYAQLGDTMRSAFEHYVRDVKAREFPSKDESY
ncbi:MAG: 3-methyl-2-oxobutanoate hydroxymethyltransferase [Planctomycetaceae bacterium]|nr:3-methyl-2-oxobutanoate hydroxymethyltransferase [Planctomycetaceae bacterium]